MEKEERKSCPAMDTESRKYAFFRHTECECFPCHRTGKPEEFNCLFCYCPLYVLGKNCGGNYRYTTDGKKDCSDCVLPHVRENYDYIVGRYDEIVQWMKRNEAAE